MPETPARRRSAMPHGAVRLLAAFAVVALALPAIAQPAAAASYGHFSANFAGEELMRAMNKDRQARGLPALATDSTLEAIARDRAIACPSSPSLTIRGRARDMADRNYLSHSIKGCTDAGGGSFDAFDLLTAFGYTFAAAGEDIDSNNYPASRVSYRTGCNLSGGSCHGSIHLPWTVAVAERTFMSSSQHRANILSTSYGRFGCAAWASSSGYHYYACYFIKKGNGLLDGSGPAVSGLTGVGAHFKTGSTPTFSATFSDARSLLSDGYAAIDGVHISNWAWDHVGSSASISVTAPPLKAGTHTFTWRVRDASTRKRTVKFTFTVSG
jgi:uncharacterized protein YkwD